jgi:hypothetical protein
MILLYVLVARNSYMSFRENISKIIIKERKKSIFRTLPWKNNTNVNLKSFLGEVAVWEDLLISNISWMDIDNSGDADF